MGTVVKKKKECNLHIVYKMYVLANADGGQYTLRLRVWKIVCYKWPPSEPENWGHQQNGEILHWRIFQEIMIMLHCMTCPMLQAV